MVGATCNLGELLVSGRQKSLEVPTSTTINVGRTVLDKVLGFLSTNWSIMLKHELELGPK
eukprot:2685032-Amphidinium_carterae.1